jgi:hypothetical protein
MDNVNFLLLGALKNRFAQGIRKSKSGPTSKNKQQGRPYGGQGKNMSPLKNVKNLVILFIMIRKYLFK